MIYPPDIPDSWARHKRLHRGQVSDFKKLSKPTWHERSKKSWIPEGNLPSWTDVYNVSLLYTSDMIIWY